MDEENIAKSFAEGNEHNEVDANNQYGNNNYVNPPSSKLTDEQKDKLASSSKLTDEQKDKLASWIVSRFGPDLKETQSAVSDNDVTESVNEVDNNEVSESGDLEKTSDAASGETHEDDKDISETDDSDVHGEEEETGKEEENTGVVTGENKSYAFEPDSSYAQKFGIGVKLLDDVESVEDVSGISIVRYFDEKSKEYDGAYRVTYDFASGNTVNRLFTSYAVSSEVLDGQKDINQDGNLKTDEEHDIVDKQENAENSIDVKSDEQENKSEEKEDLEPVPQDILVDKKQLQMYLKSAKENKPDEYFRYDTDNKVFKFNVCGAEGIYNPQSKSFQKLAINGEAVADDDLKKYLGTQLFNMVPMGSMLGEAAGNQVTSASLQEMALRDKAVAACKDERLQELLEEINGSCKRMTQLSKKCAGERDKIDDLIDSNRKASIPSRLWNRVASKYYRESEDAKGFTKKTMYKAFKPSIMKRQEQMNRPKERIEALDAEFSKEYKFYKSRYEELQRMMNNLPLEVSSQYGKELRRLSEGLRCFEAWEQYRSSDAFNKDSSAEFKNYADAMSHNLKLISKDFANCASLLSHVHDESCNCCYDREIKSRSRQESIEQCTIKEPSILLPAVDNYRVYAKQGFSDQEIVSKMMVLGLDRDEIVNGLMEGSKNFVDKPREAVDRYVDQFFENSEKFNRNADQQNRSNVKSQMLDKGDKGIKNDGNNKGKRSRGNMNTGHGYDGL